MVDPALLDAHALIWSLSDPARLGPRAQARLAHPDGLWLSTATLWELGIKASIGRLTLPVPLRDVIRAATSTGGLRILEVRPEHALRAAELPLHHRDPFDRMIVAQALTEGMTLITRDPEFAAYGAPILW